METKVIHVHLKANDTSIINDWYFGSLRAIYERFGKEDIGITYKPLTNAMRGKNYYENKKVVIRIGVLYRKAKSKNST